MGVTIYDRPDRKKSPFGVKWSAGGKRKFKFFALKRDRDAYKASLEKQVAAQGREILSMSAADAAIWRECLQKAGSPAAVLRAVDRFAVSVRVRDLRIGQALKEYVNEKINAGRDDEYVRKLQGILGKLPAAAVSASFSAENARRWAAGLKVSARTLCGHVKDAVGFWNWMVRRGYAAENVFSAVALPTVAEKEPGFLTVDQAKALFKTAQADYPDAVAYLTLGAFAGLRSSAICRLDWTEHIRFEQRGILITGENAKNKRRQFVDGHERLGVRAGCGAGCGGNSGRVFKKVRGR